MTRAVCLDNAPATPPAPAAAAAMVACEEEAYGKLGCGREG